MTPRRWRMSWSDVRLILQMEICTLRRSGRAVIIAILLPLVITPLLLLATQYSLRAEQRRAESAVFRYWVTGDWADPVREMIEARTGTEADAQALSGHRYIEVLPGDDPVPALQAGRLDLAIHAVTGAEADRTRPTSGSGESSGGTDAERLPGVPLVEIRYLANRANAVRGVQTMVGLLGDARQSRIEGLLADRGFDIGFDDILPVEANNLATSVETTGLTVGRFLTLGLFMLILTGGSLVAMDILAGEKERGTLETLLTTATGRREIMAAKQLVILATAVVITLIQVGNLLVYARLDLIPLPEGFDFGFTPAAAMAMLLVLLPMAVFLAGVLLLVSAASRSYKEAQLYFFPLYLVGMLPAAAGALDVPLRSAIAVVPVAGVSVVVREVLSGQIDWLFVLLVGIVNTVAAAAVLRKAVGLLEDETVATARQTAPLVALDGPAAFRANVWKWFAVMWALFIGLGVALPDLVTQVVVSQFVLLLGSAILAIRLFRLDAAKALGIRLPRWTSWPIVVLLIVPLHALAGLVMRFANTIFPVPETYLQQIEQQFAPLAAMPWLLAFFLIAIAPGVCEELAFRGLLFFGLEKRYRGLQLALLVGLAFGFFHFDLSRIVMAGTLGVFLTVARILTGSVLPGIVMHIGNNGLALILAEAEVPVDGLEPVLYVVAAASTVALFGFLWRENRSVTGGPSETAREIGATTRNT